MFGKKMWATLLSDHGKAFVFAVIFSLSTIVAPLIITQPAYADTAGDIHDINYKHYAATYLRDCLFNLPADKKNTILQARIDNRNLFLASSHKVGIGLYFEPTGGTVGCEEGSFIKTALVSLGYDDDPGRLLTDIGYVAGRSALGCNVTNPACENGTQKSYTRNGDDKFNSFFANALGAPPQYARYVAYKAIFNSRCDLVEPPTGGGSAVTYKNIVKGTDGNYTIEDAKAEFVIEDRKGAKFDTGKTAVERFEYENRNTTCRDLLSIIDGLAESVRVYNNANKSDPILALTIPDIDDPENCTANPTAEGCEGNVTTCAIEGIGWLICPTMNFIAGINDTAYSFLASSFLSVDTGLVINANDAWSKFRDIANILFVIALLFVVYSQITSVGITNYGIKKMLPRIVVAAVLVNTSFLICQLAVDLSNILGYGLSSFFVTTLNVGTPITDDGANMLALGEGLKWTAVTATVLAAAAGMALAVSVPVLLSSLLAIGMIVLILVARQALIVLLVAIAPLAFVAYLLPNTEEWFKKWRKAFFTLLLLFPIIALVFGASSLAANIINKAAGKDGNVVYQYVALGVSVIPFFVVPGLLKGAMNAAGSIGAKLSGLADRSGKMVGKSIGEHSQIGAYKKAWDRNQQIKRAQIQGGVYNGKGPIASVASRLNRGLNASKLTGSMGTRTAQQAAGMAEKLEIENVNAANAQIRQANIDSSALRSIATGGTDAKSGLKGGDASMRAAAAQELMNRGEFGGLADAWDGVRGEDKDTRRVFADTMSRASNRPAYIGQGALGKMRTSEDSSGIGLHDAVAKGGIQDGAYSPEKMAAASKEELGYAHKVASEAMAADPTDIGAMQRLVNSSHDALANPETNKAVNKNRAVIEQMSRGQAATTAAPNTTSWRAP